MHAAIAGAGFEIGYNSKDHTHGEAKLADALHTIHRELAPRPLYRVLVGLVEHDELIALWRQHHGMMVERLIGDQRGTGGSAGATYLRSTIRYRFYPELWAAPGSLGETE